MHRFLRGEGYSGVCAGATATIKNGTPRCHFKNALLAGVVRWLNTQSGMPAAATPFILTASRWSNRPWDFSALTAAMTLLVY